MVRHGETDWNRDNRFQGHADPPLNDRGRRQAGTLARDLEEERFDAVYSSPLRRASETAAILVAARAVQVRFAEALREVDVGSWSGLTRDEIERQHPTGYQRWLEYGHGWDDGETYDELGRRVLSWLVELGAAHDGANILAVTHGGPIRSALAAAGKVGFDEARRSIDVVGNCAVVRFALRDGILERVD